jgi:hypothetical protein
MPVSPQGTIPWPSQINWKYWWTPRLWVLYLRTTKSKLISLKRGPQTTWNRGVPRKYRCVHPKIAPKMMSNPVWHIQSRASTSLLNLTRVNRLAPMISIAIRMNTTPIPMMLRKTIMRKYRKRSVYWAVITTKRFIKYIREQILWWIQDFKKDNYKEIINQTKINWGWFKSIGRQSNNGHSNNMGLFNSHQSSSRNWTT